MQRSSIASLLFLFVSSSLATACSSSDFQTAPTDGGTSDTESSDTSTPVDSKAEAGCILPPTATGTEGPMCDALAGYYSRCGHCEGCVQTNANNCIAFGDALSEIYKNAFVACRDKLPCGADFSKLGSDPCIQAELAKGTLSAKQLEAKLEYCKACPTKTYECDSYFGAPPGDAGVDAGVAGIGGAVVLSNDDSVQKTIDGCKGGAACDPYLYVLCSLGKFCGPMPKDACGSNFCK